MKLAFAALAGLACVPAAFAQSNGLYNGGMEEDCHLFCPDFGSGPSPQGWTNHSHPESIRRAVGDGRTPAFFPVGTPGALTPRTGDAVMSIGTLGNGDWTGYSTDTINWCYCQQTCTSFCGTGPWPFYDPYFDYNMGDVVVTAWYMIPADAPVTGDIAGIKLHIKTGNQDVASMDYGDPLNVSISGHTNGQWRQLTVVFPRAEIQRQYECNLGVLPNCGCACVPADPLPNHIKVVPGRWVEPGTATSGTIYFDDISVTQLPPTTGCTVTCDYNDDGGGDNADVTDMANAIASDTDPFPTHCKDFNQDGGADNADVTDLANAIAGGTCP